MRTGNRRSLLTRGAAVLASAIVGGAGLVVTATPAAAASCATNAHVYVITPSVLVKTEFDAIDGPTHDVSVFANSSFSFQLGGNGLEPGTVLFWDVYDQNGTFLRTVNANSPGSNCVANQRSFSDSGSFGTFHTYRANYEPGNSAGVIRNQAHFRLLFNQFAPPPPPPPDDCPFRICPILE